MAEWDHSPWGPWTDYGRPLHGAEEATSAVIDQILTDGGTLLWQKYLERKAFTFAASAITEALVSRLRMSYVHHDHGEDADLDAETWSIEDEPEPGEIDSWARMHLPVRRLAPPEAGGSSTKSRFASSRRNPGSRGRANTMGQSLTKEKEKPSERSTPLELVYNMDAEEERLREAKARESAAKREKEKKAKEAGKNDEEDRKKVQQLHEEMSKRPHTFDTEGNLIWVVDDFKPDRLPKLQEAFGFLVKKDPRALRETQDLAKTTAGLAPSTPEDNRKKSNRRSKNPKKELTMDPEFADGFSKLQHGQPPILETMLVQSGVTLESMGKRKPGPEPDGERFMSRREYVQLAEREVAMDGGYQPNFGGGGGGGGHGGGGAGGGGAGAGGGGAAGGGGGAAGGAGGNAGGGVGGDGGAAPAGAASPTSPAGAGASAGQPGGQQSTLSSAAIAAQMEAAGKAGLSPGGLPQIPAGRGIAGAAGQGGNPAYPGGPPVAGGPAADGRGEGAPVQKAPRAPPQYTRNKKFEALGFVRPPRYHVPQLGGPQGFGSAQPPLGATMGHGLIRSGSHKEAYFFPPNIPDLPTSLLRSSSDTVLGSPGRSARGPNSAQKLPRDLSGADKGDAEGSLDQEDAGGRLRAEMSPAYRHFRSALIPSESSNGFSGSLRR